MKLHKRYIDLILAIALLLVVLPLLSQTIVGGYPIYTYSPSDYRAGNQNIDITQNRDMSLFVANNLGILSFNGTQWESHIVEVGRKNRSVAFDQKLNILYVGLQGGFGYLDNDWEYHSLLDLVAVEDSDVDEVWDVFLANDLVYFCTFKGIYIYDGDEIKVARLETSMQKSFLVNGKIYAQSAEGKLFTLENDQFKRVKAQSNSGEVISGVLAQGADLVLIYNSGKIERISGSPPTSSAAYLRLSKALQGTFVNHVCVLSDARIAVSTQLSGVVLYDLQTEELQVLEVSSGLSSNACLYSYEDFDGNLWIGMQNGIAQVRIQSPVRMIHHEGMGSGYDVLQMDQESYYSTSNGIYHKSSAGDHIKFVAGTEGPGYDLLQISGRIYACHHAGLFLLENGTARRVAQTDGLWTIQQMTSRPDVFLGGTYSGLHVFRVNANGVLSSVHKISGFDESSRFFAESRDGAIWVGQYYKGLFRLELDSDTHRATVENISQDSVLPIEEQVILAKVDGNILIGTRAGIYSLGEDYTSISRATEFEEDIGEQPVYLIEQDQQKNVHIIGDNTIGYFNKISANNYSFVPSSIAQFKYQLNNDLLNVSAERSGIYYSANEGFLNYEPSAESGPQEELDVGLAKVTALGIDDGVLFQKDPFRGTRDSSLHISLPKHTNVIRFEVESFQFASGEQLEYRYQLEGFEDGYEAWTNSSVKEYSNLDGGDYTLNVQVRDEQGALGQMVPVRLSVEPTFLQSALAKGLGALLLGLIGYSFYRYQKNKYRRKASLIEEEKTKELLQNEMQLEKVKLEKDSVVLRLKEEKLQTELQHLNSLLAASTMNLVVKNQFIETIKSSLGEVKESSGAAKTKNAIDRIVRNIDTNLRVDQDWEHFEHHFDQVHGGFLQRLRQEYKDLSPNDQKLCAFLRLNLSTKEIANLMSVSLRGVEVARYRLRKKLGLQKGQNLSKFILEF